MEHQWTRTVPFIPGWMLQRYWNVPLSGNSREAESFCSNGMFCGAPALVKVTSCCTAPKVQVTVPPAPKSTAVG